MAKITEANLKQMSEDIKTAVLSGLKDGFKTFGDDNKGGKTNTNTNRIEKDINDIGEKLKDKNLTERQRKWLEGEKKKLEDEKKYGKYTTEKINQEIEAEAKKTYSKISNNINLIVRELVKLSDGILQLTVTIKKSQMALAKNITEREQSIFEANLNLLTKSTQTHLKTLSSFTTQLATDAAFSVYKASSETAVANFKKMKDISIAEKQFSVAEKQRLAEKTEGMWGGVETVTHAAAGAALAIGAAFSGVTYGTSLLVGAIVAGAIEISGAVKRWVVQNKKLNVEEARLQKEIYENKMKQATGDIEFVQKIVSDFDDVVKNVTDFVRDNDSIYKNIGISLGMGGDKYSSYARNISVEVSKLFGITAKQTEEMMDGYVDSAGRTLLLSAKDFNNIYGTGRLFGMSDSQSASLYGGMNIFNTSIESGSASLAKMYNQITKMGLSTKKFGADLVKNLKLAEKYNFKGGVDNMMKLTKWAQQTRFNLNSAASFADSIMNDSLSGALEKSAKLQVLGGNAAIYSDPLGMLYDAGADVGNMAKRMHQMFGDISGTFNAKTGETEFSWYENRMLAARAQAMGMDPGEVKNMIRQSNKQGVIDRALKGFKLDEETRTAIGNRATYDKKTGEWMVDTMNGQKTIKEVANMTDDERNKVLFPTEEGEAIIDIMKNVRSIKEREEANKLEGYSKSQISLFDAVTAASQKNIEAQNTIINNNNDFIETAKQRLANISDNAVTEARATVEFFEKNKDLIDAYQKFVEESIKNINNKEILEQIRATLAISSKEGGATRLSELNDRLAKIEGAKKGKNWRAREFEKFFNDVDPDEKKYLRSKVSTELWNAYEANKQREEAIDKRLSERVEGHVQSAESGLTGYPIRDGAGQTNGGIITGASNVKSINDGSVNIRTASSDQYLAAMPNGPIDKILQRLIPGLQALLKQNSISNSSSNTMNINFSGKILLSQDGSTVNLVELMKNNPMVANKFISVIQRAMDRNRNGKSTQNYLV